MPSILNRLFFGLLCSLWFVPVTVVAQQKTEEQLRQVQEEIKRKQQAIRQQQSSVSTLQHELKKAEIAIANSAASLRKTRQQKGANQSQQKQLKTEKSSLTRQLNQQKSLLANQLKAAYTSGNHDYAKMLFNQQDAGKMERSLVYYKYLNQARQAQIFTFTEMAKKLTQVVTELKDKQQELGVLETQQLDQQNQLKQQQQTRHTTVASLNKKINSQAVQIEQLQFSEQNLRQAIEQAQEQATQTITLNGLKSDRGRLPKPAKGRMRKLFGSRRQGQVKWKGVLINGNEGSPVSAIQQGKVIFADWLKGFGLVTVVDHGQGYMSLYGHNQALLKQAGDQVTQGEDIALVGQSGGQTRPALYFEIRYKGKPVNPSRWLVR